MIQIIQTVLFKLTAGMVMTLSLYNANLAAQENQA